MSYEYVFYTPKYKQLDKGLIEVKVPLLPCAFECTARDGSRFYIVAGDEETKNFVQKMVESDREHLAVPELVDQVTIECDKVWVSCCGSANEALRMFCTWLVDEFGCLIEDEFDSPSSLEEMFPPLAQR